MLAETTTRTVTLICSDWVGAEDLALSIDRTSGHELAFAIKDLCIRPRRIGALIESLGADRLVLGVCSIDFEVAEVQKEARKAGLDALGIETVALDAAGGSSEKATLLLAAAGARAAAFAGSAPEHSKMIVAAKMSRRSLFSLSIPEYRAAPSIDVAECAAPAGCTACVDVCPQRALAVSGGRIVYDKSACKPCGLCVTACPTGAVANPAITPAQIDAEVRALLGYSSIDIGPRGIVFTCRSGPTAGIDLGWMPVRLPCAGMAPVSWLMAPLLLGASAVAVIPCDERCPAGQADAIRDRVAYTRELLEQMGAKPDLVGTSADNRMESSGPPSPITGNGPNLFDKDAAADVMLAVRDAFGAARDVFFEHPMSPLGTVAITQDLCTGCGMCALRCPTNALDLERAENLLAISFDARACVACGNCIPYCPEEGAIDVTKAVSTGHLGGGRTELYTSETATCISCGGPLPPEKMLAKIGEMLGSEHGKTFEIVSRYCMGCRSRATTF